ncbi:HAMP domain-containing histidine kinase [Desulfovibrio sp. OttesenSCG-928-I05]|nr:HAMP domain-containing histidine kinase [Desulfovibrio sp. OttesenSCG-928-I05]
MRHLWQRIFGYSLILVLLSQVAVFFLHRYSQEEEGFRRFIVEATEALAESIDGQNAGAAGAVVSLFSRGNSRAWIENADGTVLLGRVPESRPDFSTADREWKGKAAGAHAGSPLTIWQFGTDEERFVAAMPVRLAEGERMLYLRFGPPRRPGMWPIFMQGLVLLTLMGGMLAFWMSRRVSRPLRQLRDEVLDIAGGKLDKRVTVRGHDEIRDLSLAVNHMADSLSKHVRNMRELVANISHELRSPLARMQVSFALLEEDLTGEGPDAPGAPGVAGMAGEAVKNAGRNGESPCNDAMARLVQLQEELEHMNTLIGTTLLSSRLDLHEAPLAEVPVAFSELCAAMARRQTPLFAKRDISFRAAVEDGIIVGGDETLLCTLVSNLLDNAEKYTERGGSASLSLRRAKDGVILEVENSHEPVAAEALEHIFEPFNRAGIATGNGVGLGLSLVRQIATLHKGAVEARNVTGGIVFTVRFPLS